MGNHHLEKHKLFLTRGGQSCKLLQHLGTSCPVGLETGYRILKVNFHFLDLFELLLDIFGLFLDIFGQILNIFGQTFVDLRYMWTDYVNFYPFVLLLSVGF